MGAQEQKNMNRRDSRRGSLVDIIYSVFGQLSYEMGNAVPPRCLGAAPRRMRAQIPRMKRTRESTVGHIKCLGVERGMIGRREGPLKAPL